MLLSIIALALGSAIGKARGGSWLGVTSIRIRGKGFLVVGIGATLVLNVLSPSSAMFWLIVSTASFFGFALFNLPITGMIVLLIGLSLNVLPMVANGAVPVSEVALQSVGSVDDLGAATIDGPRESTATATTLSFLGDVVPVPLVSRVVSLGDLIVLVAIADIAMNLFLRRREREIDDAGVSYTQGQATDEPAIDLTDAQAVDGPAHAAPGRRLFSAPLPLVRRPSHAAKIKPHRPTENPREPKHAAEPANSIASTPAMTEGTAPTPRADIDPSSGSIDLTDRRPIIDLTSSPTDEQLAEFISRRADADHQLSQLAPPSPGHRRHRSRTRRRRGEVAETPR